MPSTFDEMGQVTDRIRMQVGEGELSEAIETLTSFLKTVGGELYNQSIFLKGKHKEYEREKILGMGDKPELRSQISMAVLNLADDIDERQLENPPTSKDFTNMAPKTEHIRQQQQQFQQQPQFQQDNPHFQAQCIFQGDMAQYYLAYDNSIWMYNPLNNQTFQVGMKLPSQDFRFAWTLFMTATGIYYLVDRANIIWGQNFGMPVQVGFVKNL